MLFLIRACFFRSCSFQNLSFIKDLFSSRLRGSHVSKLPLKFQIQFQLRLFHGGIDWSRYAKGYLRRISKVSCTAIRVTQICLHRRTWKC